MSLVRNEWVKREKKRREKKEYTDRTE